MFSYFCYEIFVLLLYYISTFILVFIVSFFYRSTLGQIFLEPCQEIFILGSFSVRSLEEILQGELKIIFFLSMCWLYILFLYFFTIFCGGILFCSDFIYLIFLVLFNCTLVGSLWLYSFDIFVFLMELLSYLYLSNPLFPSLFIMDFSFVGVISFELALLKLLIVSVILTTNFPLYCGFFFGYSYIKKNLFVIRFFYLLFFLFLVVVCFPPDIFLHISVTCFLVVLLELVLVNFLFFFKFYEL